MPLILSDEDVRRCAAMADAIAAIERMCRSQARGTAILGERLALPMPNGWMRLMPAALTDEDVLGYKEFHLSRVVGAAEPLAHVRYAYHLFAYASGEPLAIMDADYLTFIRTAAASAVAISRLAREDAHSVGVIGSGAEARSHLDAALAVRPIRRARVYSRDPQRRQRFAADMSERHGIEVLPVERPEAAIEEADILVVATNTAGAGVALQGAWLRGSARAGLHVNSIGSTSPTQRELDPEVWAWSERTVVDSRRLLTEGGDGRAAVQSGTAKPEEIGELHEVVSDRSLGRTHGSQRTLYKSIGTGLQDIAVAQCVYARALAAGLGHRIDSFQSIKAVEPN